jgi:hypothetical protein
MRVRRVGLGAKREQRPPRSKLDDGVAATQHVVQPHFGDVTALHLAWPCR